MELTEENFQQSVSDSTKTVVIVDFYAPWCRPCSMMAPILEKVGINNPSAAVYKVNTDEQMNLALKYNISSLPTLLFFKNGVEVKRLVGLQSETTITNAIMGK
jgi:thioredoxin